MYRMTLKYWIWACLLFSVPGLQAQKIWSDEELEKLTSPDLLAGADTLLTFDKKEIEVGTISEDDKPSVYVFSCKNAGNTRVVVTRMTTSCGCTQAEIDRPVLLPGEQAQIRLTYNPFGRPGKLFAQVLVYTDRSDKYPVASLALTGKVTPSAALWKNYRYAMGHLKLRRKQVNFGVVRKGQKRVERIACVNAGDQPLQVSAAKVILPEYLSVYTLPAVLQPSEEGQLVVAIDGTKLPPGKDVKKSLKVLLEGLSVSPTERMLEVSLQYGVNEQSDKK
jgi:hypothetical protein